MFLISFANDLERCLAEFDEKIEVFAGKKEWKIMQIKLAMKQMLHDVILYHSDVKQLSRNISLRNFFFGKCLVFYVC